MTQSFPAVAERFLSYIEVLPPLHVCGAPDEALLAALKDRGAVKLERLEGSFHIHLVSAPNKLSRTMTADPW